MHQLSIPVFTHNLNNLAAILKKGAEFAQNKKIEETVLLNSRLAADMFPLVRQVQIACDSAKAGAARIAGVEIPAHPDNENSFAELDARIAKTVKFLESIDKSQIDGAETRKINYTQRNKEYNFIGLPYLLNHVLPNVFFHVTTAYAILRHNGVEIGKKDYLGTK